MTFVIFSLVVLIVPTAIVQWRAGARERTIEADFPPLGDIVMVDGRPIHVHVKGDGPDLIMIHGSSGNLRDFTFGLVDRLAKSYRVISVDRPGLGYSDRLAPTQESIFNQAQVLKKAADHVGAKRPIVLGQSYGGTVALAWAVNFPEDTAALVLIGSPTQPWDGAIPALYRLNSSRLGAALAVPIITAFVPQGYIHSQIKEVFEPEDMPEGYDAYVGAELAARRHSLRANAAQRAHLLGEVRDMHPRYPELELPIEMIHGTADAIVPLEIHGQPFLDAVPSASLQVLKDVGHLPQHTAPEATIAAIDRAAVRAGLR